MTTADPADPAAPAAPAWSRRVVDSYGNDLRDPADLLAAMVARYASASTRKKYLSHIKQFFLWMERWHPDTHLLLVTPPHIDLYRQYLVSNHWEAHPGECVKQCESLPVSEASKRVKISAIAQYYVYCVSEKRCTANPVQPEPGRQHHGDSSREKVKDILMPFEILDVMEHCKRAANGQTKSTSSTLRSAVVFGTFVGPGLRCGELAKARVENLGWRGKTRTLRFQRKGGAWQTIDLPDAYAKVLGAYLGSRTHGPLILNERGRRRNPDGELELAGVSDDTLRDIITEIGEVTGIRENLYPHLLRHTSITLALTEPDAKPHRVMVYYGHAKMDTTMGYYNFMSLLTPGPHHNPYGLNWKTQGVVLAA
jgi:site-specific recombinase XerD